MKQFLAIVCAIFLFSASCKKDGKGCWEAVTPVGAPVIFNPPLCDITKKEAEERYPNYWFYRAGTATNCYRLQFSGSTSYVTNMAEEVVQKHTQSNPAYQYTKVDCASFCNITWHERTRSKITGLYRCCIMVIYVTLFNPDSCSRLFTGRVITVSETADSITTREVHEKKP